MRVVALVQPTSRALPSYPIHPITARCLFFYWWSAAEENEIKPPISKLHIQKQQNWGSNLELLTVSGEGGRWGGSKGMMNYKGEGLVPSWVLVLLWSPHTPDGEVLCRA